MGMRQVAAFAAGAVAVAACTGQAAIVADFSGGAGTTASNQYRGTSGDGWAGAWTEKDDAQITGSVINTSPLKTGSGNYLSVLCTAADGNSNGDGIYRTYNNSTGLDLAAAHRVSFDFRLDSAASNLLGSGDQLVFVNDSTNAALGSSNGYGVFSAVGTGAQAGQLVWGWRNGASGVTSTMLLTTGTVYHLDIDLDPSARKFKVSIFDGTNTVTSGATPTMGYRTSSTTPLGMLMFFAKDVASPQNVTYSLDNLNVGVVPEPASLSGLALASAALVGRRRRR